MVSERLAAHWFDEAVLIAAAIERIRAGERPFERAVVFLPRVDRGLPADLLRALGDVTDENHNGHEKGAPQHQLGAASPGLQARTLLAFPMT